MSVRNAVCSYCNGSGKAEKWETVALLGCNDTPVQRIDASDCTDEVKRWVTEGLCDNVCAEWETVECPVCEGEGGYLLEYVIAKIF